MQKVEVRWRGLQHTVLLLALALGACGPMQAYPGPKLPREQIAVLERFSAPAVWLPVSVNASVTSIDGKPLEGAEQQIEMLPGGHEVAIRGHVTGHAALVLVAAMTKISFQPRTLMFRAEAGKTYRLGLAKVAEDRFVAWIEDSNGTVVGGTKPEGASQRLL